MDWDTSGSTAGIFKVWDRTHAKARRSLAATFLAVALMLFLLAGCDAESLFGGSSSNTSTALRVLDASATVMMHMDVQHSLATMEDYLPADEEISDRIDKAMEEMASHLGLNPRKDFQHIYISVSGDESHPIIGMVAFADFDHDVLKSRLDGISKLTKVESAGKTDSYQSEGLGGMSLSLVNGSMILVTNTADQLDRMVTNAIDGEGATGTNDALLRQVDKYDSWAVIRDVTRFIPEMGPDAVPSEFSQFVPVVQSARNVAVGMTTKGGEMEGALFIEPSAEVDADDLASLLSGLRAAARLNFENESLIMTQLERLDISAKKGIVSVSIEVEKDELIEVFTSMGSRLKEMASNHLHNNSQE